MLRRQWEESQKRLDALAADGEATEEVQFVIIIKSSVINIPITIIITDHPLMQTIAALYLQQ